MAGVACVEQILKHAPQFDITIFGDETHVNYNRILLSSVLAGEKSSDEITLNPLEWYRQHGIQLRVGVRVTDVDPVAQAPSPPRTAASRRTTRCCSPPAARPGCRRLRASTSTASLRSARSTTRAPCSTAPAPGTRAVVIGGGLLGLEAARGLQVQGCDVTVVHLMDTLMERQVDASGGATAAAARSRSSASASCSDAAPRRSSATAGSKAVEFERRRAHRRRPGRRCGRHPAERRAGTPRRPHRQSRHRRQRPHGDVEPRRVRGRRVRRAQRRLLRPGRAADRTGQGAGGDDDRQQGPDLHRQRAGGEAQDHGGRGLLRRRLDRRRRRRTGALRGSRARHLQEGRRARQPAERRHPGRRHLGQPSVHGLAAIRRRPDRSPAPSAVPAAGGRHRARHRADARQRHRLRLRRRHQGRDHRGHPHQGREHARAAEGTHPRQHRMRQLHGALPGDPARRWRRSSRKTSRR